MSTSNTSETNLNTKYPKSELGEVELIDPYLLVQSFSENTILPKLKVLRHCNSIAI